MAHSAPTGDVTLVFTDIQGSSALWERVPRDMRAALAEHNRTMRRQLEAEGGYEVKTEGDAFVVAFGEAAEAESCLTSARARLRAASVSSEAETPEGTPADRSDFVRLAARLLDRALPASRA